MRMLLVAVACVVACKGTHVDQAVDQYINHDLAQAHAKIVAARQAYAEIKATDIDDPGKLADLRFRLGDIAAPFLAQALAEAKKITPPAAATPFHDYTVSVVSAEAPVIAEMAAALSPVNADAFKAAHARMMELQERVFTWEEYRTRLLTTAGIQLGPLPKLQIPEPRPQEPSAGTPP